MKRFIAAMLSLLLLGILLPVPASALNYYVSHYEEAIYAGGVVDLYAYPSVGDPEDFTYQWQFDAGFGDGHWYDVPENDNYAGGKTNHLQMFTSTGNYDSWEEIPFQCVLTSQDGTVRHTANIHMSIYPTDRLIPDMKNWGFGLYTPSVKNVIDLYTKDDVNYTASAYAGAKLDMWCGSKPVDQKPILRKSEVELTTEIHITENGKTIVSTNRTTYLPYTVGKLKVEFKEKLTIGEYNLGYFDTKTVDITVSKPVTQYTAPATANCSLLRYTYNESAKLASIPKGTNLEIVGTEGSYYQVYYNGFVGYVGKSQVGNTTKVTDDLITEVDLTIPSPVAGQYPATTCTVETPSCALYHTDPITWTDSETGKEIKPTEQFQEGKQYKVQIWLAAKSGYAFSTDASGNPKLGAAINGNLPPYIYKAYEQDPREVIMLVYTFGSTPAAPETPETTEPPTAATPPASTPETHVHTPSQWRITGAYHYKVCTTCGDFLDQEDHFGGKATCKDEGICIVCGNAYLETTETHAPDTETWTACGNLYHAHLCKLCGAHCDPQDHTPGAEATDTAAQTCTTCGYILQPAKNHTHQLTHMPYVAPTCLSTGTEEHYRCSGCSTLFADAEGTKPISQSVVIPYLTHEAADSWDMDAQFHWRCCKLCQSVLDETRMVHEKSADGCATCSYGKTDPAEKPEVAPNEEKQQAAPKPWLPILLVALVSFAVAITATVIILKMKKKKGE